MKAQNLTEEINRIKEILNFDNPSIIEEQLWKTLIKRVAPNLQKQFFADLEKTLGKKLTAATEDEVVTAIKSAEMGTMRKLIAKEVYNAEKQTIDDILKKYDLTNRTQAKAALTELSANGVHPGLRREVVALSKAENKVAGAAPKPAAPKPAASKPAASSSTATAATTSTAAKATLDLENYIISKFPKISNDRNILAPLVQDFEKEISGMSTVDVINHINAKCVKVEQGLKNVADVVGQETAEKNIAISNKVKYYAKKYGPLSFNASGKTNWLKTIPKAIAWFAAIDVIVLGAVEARKEKKNLADTVAKRAAERGAGFMAAAGTFINAIIGSESDSSNSASSDQQSNNSDGKGRFN
jgi:hypothetical protein